MVDPGSFMHLKEEIAERMEEDSNILNQLREEIKQLRSDVCEIKPRNSTSIALVATDGGNNSLRFDPFLVQIVRVVDSSNNELCLEVITPTTSISLLSQKQFDKDGKPRTSLGKMMAYLGVHDLSELSPMIRKNGDGQPISPSWVQAYRELVEWASLFNLIHNRTFGNDTLIVFDGLLRSKIFQGDLFHKYLDGIAEGIEQQRLHNKHKIYLAGVAKHSKVLSRYRLAMALEHILNQDYPVYLPIPGHIEKNAYIRADYALQDDQEGPEGEINKFVGGKMYFVKFGSGTRDPIWPVDIFARQIADAPKILGHMLSDTINGFPVPAYPLCLQKAHANAAMIDFDFEIIQNYVFDGIRDALGENGPIVDAFRFQDSDPAQRRYNKNKNR